MSPHQNDHVESHKRSLAISGIMALAGLIVLVGTAIAAVTPETATMHTPQDEVTTAM